MTKSHRIYNIGLYGSKINILKIFTQYGPNKCKKNHLNVPPMHFKNAYYTEPKVKSNIFICVIKLIFIIFIRLTCILNTIK